MRNFPAVLFIFAAFVVFNAPKVFCQTGANDFSVTTIDGKTYDSAKLRGKIIVVNLWYINCPNCFEEIKQLNKLVDDYQAEQNVIFLGLATDNAAKLKTFLNKNPFKYQIVPSAVKFNDCEIRNARQKRSNKHSVSDAYRHQRAGRKSLKRRRHQRRGSRQKRIKKEN